MKGRKSDLRDGGVLIHNTCEFQNFLRFCIILPVLVPAPLGLAPAMRRGYCRGAAAAGSAGLGQGWGCAPWPGAARLMKWGCSRGVFMLRRATSRRRHSDCGL